MCLPFFSPHDGEPRGELLLSRLCIGECRSSMGLPCGEWVGRRGGLGEDMMMCNEGGDGEVECPVASLRWGDAKDADAWKRSKECGSSVIESCSVAW
jgi:hypothetical protein